MPEAIATGTISPVPATAPSVVAVVDRAIFTSILIEYTGGSGFNVRAMLDPEYPAGTYSGTVAFQLYEDAAHEVPYQVTGASVPYQVTVDPELTLQVAIDGVTVHSTISSSSTAVTQINLGTIYWNPAAPSSSFSVRPGQVIALTASVPVSWTSPDQEYPLSLVWTDAPTVTDTTLVQTVPSIGAYTHIPYVAMPKTANQYGAGFTFDIAP
jgi:hypothetical protein